MLWVSFLSDYSSSKKFKRILKWLNQKWKERNWERTELHLMWIIFVSNIHWKGILGHVRCNNKKCSTQLVHWFSKQIVCIGNKIAQTMKIDFFFIFSFNWWKMKLHSWITFLKFVLFHELGKWKIRVNLYFRKICPEINCDS